MPKLEESRSPMEATLTTATRYFEIESELAGARYAVWVTTPLRYDVEDISYGIVYQPDGNGVVGTMARFRMLRDDPINPHVPFISVCVGYAGKDAENSLAVRARDLLPPNEPLHGATDEATFLEARAKSGYLDEEGAKQYWHNLNNPAADKFLRFLERELHPLLKAEYRIDDSAVGLFGHSYGGLFASWVSTRPETIFSRIGASSPGILAGTSAVLSEYDQRVAEGADFTGRQLHVGVAEKEITARSSYAFMVGAGTAEFYAKLTTTPLKGHQVTTNIVPDESHFSVIYVVLASFLRACYGTDTTSGMI